MKTSGIITETNTTVGNAQSIKWEKYGNIVYLTSQENVNTGSSNYVAFLDLTLPEIIRPYDYKAVAVYCFTAAEGGFVGRTMIYPDGKVRYNIPCPYHREFKWTITYLV